MSGVSLLELDSEDLLDVLHYMFEEDHYSSTAEQAEAKDRLRSNMYEMLYFKPYMYATQTDTSSTVGPPLDEESYEDEQISQFDPQGFKMPTKAYTPPTDFDPGLSNPYHGVLDAPLGH